MSCRGERDNCRGERENCRGERENWDNMIRLLCLLSSHLE